jgi:hypothetical protein
VNKPLQINKSSEPTSAASDGQQIDLKGITTEAKDAMGEEPSAAQEAARLAAKRGKKGSGEQVVGGAYGFGPVAR